MNLDLGPAFRRAQAVVNGLVATIPGLIVALVAFGSTDVPASRKVADAIRRMSVSRPRGAEGE